MIYLGWVGLYEVYLLMQKYIRNIIRGITKYV